MTLVIHGTLRDGTKRALEVARGEHGLSGRALARGLERVLREEHRGGGLCLGNALLKLKLIDLQTAFELVLVERAKPRSVLA